MKNKNDEETLLMILDKVDGKIINGYLIGDYIETNYASNEKFMRKAVSFWKGSIYNQQKLYGKYAMQTVKCKGFPEKYAVKIRKYEPTYVVPEQDGGVISRFIGILLGMIISIIKSIIKK